MTWYQFSKLFRAAWEKGLTMKNIIAGFQTTGVFPFDRSAVDLRGCHMVSEKRMSLTQKTGLQFIPLYSPHKSTQSSPKPQFLVFESDEMEVYQRQYDEGYDLPDQRYQQWVKMYHPESLSVESSALLEPTPENDIEGIRLDHSSDHDISSAFTENSLEPASSTPNSSATMLPRSSFLSRLLTDKVPTLKTTQRELKRESRVLTSAENLRSLKERERKKKEETELKEKKRIEREQKRIRIEEEKERGWQSKKNISPQVGKCPLQVQRETLNLNDFNFQRPTFSIPKM